MATAYVNMSGTGIKNVEYPYQDDIVFVLTLKDDEGDVIDLTGMAFEFECYYGNYSTRFTTTGVLAGDNLSVTFTKKDVSIPKRLYSYRIRKTVDDITTTPVRGKLKIT